MRENINLPNAISLCRLMTMPIMMWCIITGNKAVFTWLLFSALVSDIADGLIARSFHLQTKFGARLDSCADMSMYISAVTGLFVFQREFIVTHALEITIILGFYVTEKIKTFSRYHRPFNSFHTYCSKVTAYAQGAFVMSLFFWGFKAYLFYPSMILCICGNIEEMVLTSLLPTDSHDVKGLYWVLRKRRTKP